MTAAFIRETVLDVRHWTDDYFSFTTSRDDGFRFDNGQFVMIGLEVEGRPLLRAYSIASANWEEQLEFFSIKVADGPLTSRLQHIVPGDTILIGRKPTGTLLISDLHPGRNLYLLGTGTGLAPWLGVWALWLGLLVAWGKEARDKKTPETATYDGWDAYATALGAVLGYSLAPFIMPLIGWA